MNENLILITIIFTCLFYSLGGLGTPPFKKGWRRYGIPLLYTIISIINGSYNFNVFLATIILCIALHLGYGENSNWFMKVVYALAISLPVLIIKFNFWMIILPVIFLGTFYLSNKPKWQYIFNWRICEALSSGILGILWSQML